MLMNTEFKFLNKAEVEENIDYMMFNLDFDKITSVMEFTKWSWNNEGTPEKYEIQRKLKTMLLSYYKILDDKILHSRKSMSLDDLYKQEELKHDSEFCYETSSMLGGFDITVKYFPCASKEVKDKHLYTVVKFVLESFDNYD